MKPVRSDGDSPHAVQGKRFSRESVLLPCMCEQRRVGVWKDLARDSLLNSARVVDKASALKWSCCNQHFDAGLELCEFAHSERPMHQV